MKTELTIKESAKLIKLGLAPRLASTRKVEYDKKFIPHYHAVFTLIDILSILPKEINDDYLTILSIQLDMERGGEKSGWMVGYNPLTDIYSRSATAIVTINTFFIFQASELIDALNSLLIWAIENNFVKPNKDN